MNTQTRRDIRLGLIALVLSGVLFTLSVAVRGPINTAPGPFVQTALSSTFVPGVTIGLAGGLIQIYGLFGLYRYLTYQKGSWATLLATVCSIAGIALILPLVTFLAVNAPVIARQYQRGNQEVFAILEANFASTLGLVILGVSSVAGILGAILFAVAIWRHGRLPKWTGVLFGLSGLLLGLSGPGFFTTELLGTIALLLSASVIAWIGWWESMSGAVK